jgi:phosphoserine phosphatase RsbX
LASGVPGQGTELEWGMAARALPGETSSGDLSLVKATADGVLAAVVNALGHGVDAAAAARKAVDTLERYAHEPLVSLMQRCHAALLGTRGVVMSLASFNIAHNTMTWLGVGNVEGVVVFADARAKPRRTSLVIQGGIVGADLHRFLPGVVPLTPGDTLIFATDGIRSGFAEDQISVDSCQQVADHVLSKYAKETDDALVLVVRYLGRG